MKLFKSGDLKCNLKIWCHNLILLYFHENKIIPNFSTK